MSTARRSKGTGSVYQRADGAWVAQVELGVTNGRRRYRRWSFSSQKAAQQHLRTVQGSAVLPPAKPPRLSAFLAAALVARADRLRPRTLRSYQRTVDLHIAPFLGHLAVTQVTPAAIDAWLKTLRLQTRGTATVRYARVVLRALLRDAERAGWLVRNPVSLSAPVRHAKRDMQPLTELQAAAVLRAAAGHRIAPLVVVLLGLGLRLGEALGLQWPDVDFTAGRIAIRRTLQRVHTIGQRRKTALRVAAPKTTQSRRTITMPALVHEALEAQRLETAPLASPWVFCSRTGTPTEPRNVNRAWYRIRADAGVPTLRLHDLRHSAATFALVLGIPARTVADMLGHAETRTTLNLYTHILPAVRDDLAAQIDVLLRSFTAKPT